MKHKKPVGYIVALAVMLAAGYASLQLSLAATYAIGSEAGTGTLGGAAGAVAGVSEALAGGSNYYHLNQYREAGTGLGTITLYHDEAAVGRTLQSVTP